VAVSGVRTKYGPTTTREPVTRIEVDSWVFVTRGSRRREQKGDERLDGKLQVTATMSAEAEGGVHQQRSVQGVKPLVSKLHDSDEDKKRGKRARLTVTELLGARVQQ